MDDNAFELALSDPNWGVGAGTPTKKPHVRKQRNGTKLVVRKSNTKSGNWDEKPADAAYGKELFRISKNQIIWGANFFDWIVPETFKPPRREDFEKFIAEHPTGWIIWDKLNGDTDQWDCELAWTSFNRPTVIFPFLWQGMMQGSKADGTIQEGNKKLNEKRFHPTQKPTQLYKWQLLEYANPGDKIIDTHFGSLSSGVACHELGFDLEAWETDIDYFTGGRKRLQEVQSQVMMF